MTRILAVLGTSACLAIATAASGQSASPAPRVQMPRPGVPMPPRDTSARPTSPTPEAGTASLSGRVVAAETGQPLRRATVVAMPMRMPDVRRGGGFTPPRSFAARTDEDGRYTIRELPAGEYSLNARRAGYVDMGYGQITSGTPPRRITVAEGAALGPLDFQLPRGGVITGRIFDEGGEPAERVQVRAVRAQRAGGNGRFFGAGNGDSTDDQGYFRLFGLAPGDYLVVADPSDRRMFGPGQALQGVDTDIITTYGPGTVNPAEAQKVHVQAGVESTMDIQLVSAKVATVRGRVTSSKGEPLSGGFVRLQATGPEAMGPGMGMGKGGPIMPDGRFEIESVAPGTYMLVAQAPMREGPRGPEESMAFEAATQTIVVAGEDVDLSLATNPGSTARGRLVVDGNAAALADRELRVMGVPPSGTSAMMTGPPGRGRVADDLSFEITGLRGLQVLSVQSLPEGWWIKDVRVGGQSALDGFDFGGGRAFSGVEIVLSGRPTGLAGTVALPTGAAAADYAVVLFPEDESRWEQIGTGVNLFNLGRIVRPGLDGEFKMQGLRPGTYYVLAVPAEQGEYQTLSDPEQLRTLASRARTVEIKEGEVVPVTLTRVER